MTHIPDPHPPEDPDFDETSCVLIDIATERRRQIESEGWTPEHDDQHDKGELARAAACYSYAAFQQAAADTEPALPVPLMWPWAPEWWKPKPPRRALVKAAALIVAEIERLDRAESS